MASTSGERFAHALGAKDAVALSELLAHDIDFKALTPGRFWEASDASSLVNETLLGQWFEPTDSISRILDVEAVLVGDLEGVRYRFAISNDTGDYEIEQQAFLKTVAGRITYLRIMCSGFQSTSR